MNGDLGPSMVGDVWVCIGDGQQAVFEVVEFLGDLDIYIAGSEVPYRDWADVVKNWPDSQRLIFRAGQVVT